MKNENEKLSLEQYQEKYNKRINIKQAKNILIIVLTLIGIALAYLLVRIVLDLYNWNKIAGYVAIAIAVLIYVFLFIIPVIKIHGKKSFITRIDKSNIRNAKKYNKELRNELANKIIEFNHVTDNLGWYDNNRVIALEQAYNLKNEAKLKDALNEIYAKDIKKTSNKIIASQALKVGLLTAVSQSEKVDTLVVSVFELGLIKKIVYLYGFRPSEDQLLKLYYQVIVNSLIAYGLESVPLNASGLFGKASESIPILGSLISTAIGSTVQGTINGLLTVIIGFQTKKYLKKQFKLQNIIDDIDEDEKDEEEIMEEVKDSISKETKKIRKNSKEKE